MSIITVPKILLPKSRIDYTKWAVVACDQFTEQPEYWQQLDSACGDISTLRIILPECYLLNKKVLEDTIIKLQNKTFEYLKADIFNEIDDFILVKRQLTNGKIRSGLMVAIDLEQYGYGAKIRPTEALVFDRATIRKEIRAHIALESPHALLLFNDKPHGLIESLSTSDLLYDFDLNAGGGHLTGYKVNDKFEVINYLAKYEQTVKIPYIVGDGNHSIAAAKQYWDELKPSLSIQEQINHPARFMLCELININAPDFNFLPIHRLVLNADFINFYTELSTAMFGPAYIELNYHNNCYYVNCPINAIDTVVKLTSFLDSYTSMHPGVIVDYVHNITEINNNSIYIKMPAIDKQVVMNYIKRGKVLPKKAFSIGEAQNKRYYCECRKIIL